MVKNVLVTGGTGFIGRHLLGPLVDRGYEVTAVTSGPIPGHPAGVRWLQSDLLESGAPAAAVAATRPTHLVHLAWCGEHGRFWTDARNYSWVQASIELLQAFVEHGGSRVVTGGTCAEYDWDAGYCVERRTPLNPATPYGAAKHALQLLQESMCGLAGIGQAWGRVFLLYGPHEPPRRLFPAVINALLQGCPARCTHGEQVRDWMHVQDVADALAGLLDSSVEGPVNIASGRPIVLREAAERIAALLGRTNAIEFGAIERQPNDPALLAADTRRLRVEVGWTPRYDLEDGLVQTIQWWKERLAA